MSVFYDEASLVLVPSGYKASKVYAQKPLTADGQLTFSRASTATRVNASGLIETVASNVPRLDYLGSTCQKLQLEPQRSNLALHSSAFDNAGWGKTRATITANASVSPDGTTSAELYTDGTFTANAGFMDAGIVVTSGSTYTLSVFIKAGTSPFVVVGLYDTQDNGVLFNTTTNATTTFGTISNVQVDSYGNGWYRVSFSRVVTDATVYPNFSVRPTNSFTAYNGTSSLTAQIWGAQLEAGAYATSYIPTTSAAVTRLADACSKTGISSLIGQTEGAIFIDVNLDTRQHFTYFVIAPDATSAANYLGIYMSNAIIGFESVVGSALQAGINLSNSATGRFKIAAAYKANDFVLYVNGTQVGTDTSGSVPTCSQVGLYQYNQNQPLKYNQALLFKTRLTNAQLAEITQL